MPIESVSSRYVGPDYTSMLLLYLFATSSVVPLCFAYLYIVNGHIPLIVPVLGVEFVPTPAIVNGSLVSRLHQG